MGGLPPLGYDGIDRKLVVNEAEAETVRLIFRWYLEAGSVADPRRRLGGAGIVSKRRVFADGRTFGGVPFSRGAICQILRNRLYRGEIAHRGEVHRGNHEPIVDKDLWDAVQARLIEQSQRARGSAAQLGSRALLAGLLFDADGNRMAPTYSTNGKRRYSYYVSAPLVRGAGREGIRVPAHDLEALARKAIVDQLRDRHWIGRVLGQTSSPDARASVALAEAVKRVADMVESAALRRGTTSEAVGENEPDMLRALVDRVTVSPGLVSIVFQRAALVNALIEQGASVTHEPTAEVDDQLLTIGVSAQTLRCGKQVRLIVGENFHGTPIARLQADWSDHRCPSLVRRPSNRSGRDHRRDRRAR